MWILSLFSAMTVGVVGIGFLGLMVVCALLGIADIHKEVSGGSGTEKYAAFFWFLLLFIGYQILAYNVPLDMFSHEHAATGAAVKSFSFWAAGQELISYLLIGVVWACIEFPVSLWRTKKVAVQAWAKHTETNIARELRDYLASHIGVSQVFQASHASTVADDVKVGTALVQKYWSHIVPDSYTIGAALKELENPRQLLEAADAAFKADVKAFQDALPKFKQYTSQFLYTVGARNWNPQTAFIDFEVERDGTGVTSTIRKADLAVCLVNWVVLWWAYALNLIFGDMTEIVATKVATWVNTHLGGYVKKYFDEVFKV